MLGGYYKTNSTFHRYSSFDNLNDSSGGIVSESSLAFTLTGINPTLQQFRTIYRADGGRTIMSPETRHFGAGTAGAKSATQLNSTQYPGRGGGGGAATNTSTCVADRGGFGMLILCWKTTSESGMNFC